MKYTLIKNVFEHWNICLPSFFHVKELTQPRTPAGDFLPAGAHYLYVTLPDILHDQCWAI